MANFDFFMTGKFNAEDIRNMRERAGKTDVLFAIGQHIRERRLQQNLTRQSVAAHIGISSDLLGKFEHGACDIGFVALDRLCAEIGVDVHALIQPYLPGDSDGVEGVVALARSWTGGGKTLPIEALLGVTR